MDNLPVKEAYACWPSPERVVLVTTVDGEGKPNIISVGWKMRANSDPPVFAIALNHKSHSCRNLRETGEFVFAVPGPDLAEAVMYCGSHTGADVDKFEMTGLTAAPAMSVTPPLIEECLACVECRVLTSHKLSDHRVFFGEAVACWLDERQDSRVLMVVGNQPGCEMLYEEGRFRLGALKT